MTDENKNKENTENFSMLLAFGVFTLDRSEMKKLSYDELMLEIKAQENAADWIADCLYPIMALSDRPALGSQIILAFLGVIRATIDEANKILDGKKRNRL